MKLGIVISVIGFLIFLCIIPIYRKDHPSKPHKKRNWSFILAWVIGIIGSFIMGFGMSKVMVEDASTSNMVLGMIAGIIGLLFCVLDYPVYTYFKKNK